MTLLAYDALRVTLPGTARPVLDGIGLTVAAGEVVALVGESGSGKSVTARAALGLFPRGAQIDGRVRVDGTDLVGADPAALREVRTNKAAMIYQDPRAAINPVRRVGDFLTEPLRRVHGWSAARAGARATELLGAVGLPDPARHLRQFPHELSGGMLQRVVIAAALTTEPRLLLCDEPTTALDVSTQAEILAVLGRLQRERGLGLLLITHDIELAAAVSDRIYVMYAGRIVETAPVAELFAAPRHPYTAGLLGSSPPLDGPPVRLVPIPGAPMGLLESAPGCAFAPRCRFAEPGRCDQSPPALERHGPGEVACHRAAELVAAMGALTGAATAAPARPLAPTEDS
ncbi:ABC transporter ATP-binding protein [Streptomyces sp. NPDC051555]|uniref:ABC transporter ATP-binding protein n=1 Tax=Streptomyces sp. NPDC051555 TaxID=3365657 RepID=UPI0037B8D57A